MKQIVIDDDPERAIVASLVEAWIETSNAASEPFAVLVASLVEAWIETNAEQS